MASDLSSGCTEANELIDDEKEEGEISLEDVSSSEEVPQLRYQPKVFGQCPHCRSTGHCHTWCKNMTLNTKIFVRATQRQPLGKVQAYERAEVDYVVAEDAGKENRRQHHHHHRPHHAHHQRAPTEGLLNADLQPISSDDDLELVGLAKKKKARKKKRRKRSPSFSISPETVVDLAIKDSIHREPTRRHQSPVRRKAQPQPQPQTRKSPPPRKPSPQRMKKLKKAVNDDSPLQSRGAVTKLLKKVKKLEPFSSRCKETRSSLKDKLSNIIGGKKSDEEETIVVELKTKDPSPEVERREVTKNTAVQSVAEECNKQEVVAEMEKKKETFVQEKKQENNEEIAESKKIVLTPEKNPSETSEAAEQVQPVAAALLVKEEQRPQEPDEDLQLRVIALRSAVLKKHRTRIARAKKLQEQQSSEPVPRIESPFTSSFNEDFPLLAEICNPGSPLGSKKDDDIYCPEDMELDSDMELDNEVSMVLSGAEEEAHNIVTGGDSPYSPTDDLDSIQRVARDEPMDLSLYTPSKPTETPIATAVQRKNDTLDGSILESRPYSPSDATVYDPELPGVLNTSSSMQPPLHPPPLPPMGMMPMIPLNPMNLLGPFPIMPIGGFAPVNPMLTAAPFIPFTPTTATGNVTSQLMEEFETDLDGSPLVPIEPRDTNWKFIGEPLYLPEMSKLGMPGMPGLVPAPVLKSNKQLQKTPPTKKPSESLFRNADMTPVILDEESRASNATFKPIKLPAPTKKTVTSQPAAAFVASTTEDIFDSQKQSSADLEQDLRELEELEEQENKRRQEIEERKKQEQREAEERKKQEQREAEELEKKRKQEQREAEDRRRDKDETERRKKRDREEADRRRRQALRRLSQRSITPAPRTRRRNARTPSRAREIYSRTSSRSLRESVSRSKSNKTESSKDQSDEETHNISIEDDEQALREILLASLAKRKPNAKRKAALEATRRKAALEAAKTTSDKENVAEKPAELISVTVAIPQVDMLKETVTAAVPENMSPNDTADNHDFSLENLPPVLIPALLRHVALKRAAQAPLPLEQQPLRKVVKRLNVIPASTRAVNNAKRYQNLLLQRKLTQQKLALYKTRFAVNNTQRSISPQVVLPPNEPQRFVISLNEDTESESEADEKKKQSPTKSRPALAIPTSDFEKSVDVFLKGVRLQQELLTTSTTVNTSTAETPPMVVQTTGAVTSKTLTTMTAVPAVTLAATVALAPATVDTSPVITEVTINTSATIATPKVASMTTATSTPKARTVLNIPKPTTTASLLSSISATPQAVKHLPVSQQVEYRRLKQQIYEYEQLRLQKTKESVEAASTTSQVQQTTVKPVNISSSLGTPSFSPAALASSTPKASGVNHIPKTQLIATISPMSKPNSISNPIVVTPTKIIHSTVNVTTKTIAPTINPATKVTNSTVAIPSTSKPVVTLTKRVTKHDPKHINLLNKITESLNSQKTILNSAVNKISTLRVLTMEQINKKSSQIQQKNHCVVMDDLNKTGQNIVVAEKKNCAKKPVNKMAKSVVTKGNRKVDLEKSKSEDSLKTTWEDFRQVVNDEVQSLSNLSAEEQKKLLAETEEKLITKRHSALDDITEMSSNLRQWEIERDQQNIISAEIISLREQLRIAEEKLQGQKIKLQKIQPKVTLYQKKINLGRKECFRLSKICNGLGQQIVGPDYTVPTAGAELLNTRIKEVASHTQKLCGKKTLPVHSNNSTKTGRSLKSNLKVKVNPNLGVKGIKRKQIDIVDTETDRSDLNSESLHAVEKKISGNGAGAVVSGVAETTNVNNILNTKIISEQLMDDKNFNTKASADISEAKKSTNESQSTNLNTKQIEVDGLQSWKSTTISKEVQASQHETNSVAVSNTPTISIENDDQRFNDADTVSNGGMKTNKLEFGNSNVNIDTSASKIPAVQESNPVTNPRNNDSEASSMEIVLEPGTLNDNSETSIMEIVQEPKCHSKTEIDNNITDESNIGTSGESKSVNSNNDSSITTVSAESRGNTTNNIVESPMVEVARTSKSNVTNDMVTDTVIPSITEMNKELDSQTRCNKKVLDPVGELNKVTDDADEICTSSTVSNRAPDKMEIEYSKTSVIDAARTDEQATNPGPTIVITDKVGKVNVNNNISSVVNTSLDDYMKEMSVTDEYENVSSQYDESSASTAYNGHSTTFEEEIRLLELASESDAPQELSNDCQPNANVQQNTSDNCQFMANAKHDASIDNSQATATVEQKSVDDCKPITTVRNESANDCQPSVKTEEHVPDDSSIQNQSKKISRETFRPYESILKLLRVPRNEDFNGILCPFALMGTCIDEDCRYIHQSTCQ